MLPLLTIIQVCELIVKKDVSQMANSFNNCTKSLQAQQQKSQTNCKTSNTILKIIASFVCPLAQ